MFPEQEARPTPEVRSTAEVAGEPAPEMLMLKDQPEPAGTAADSTLETESALRIRAALTVARSDQHDERSPNAPGPPGAWIVSALPRPPLVAAMLQEPPEDELLANDSPGG